MPKFEGTSAMIRKTSTEKGTEVEKPIHEDGERARFESIGAPPNVERDFYDDVPCTD